jgi:hypothetical protein
LRDRSVDLEKKMVYVHEALEETKAHGVRIKLPKTKAGRRDITLPDIAVRVLSEHRQLLETRMKLSVGKLPDDALLLSTFEETPLQPINASPNCGEIAGNIGMPEITFHTLWHTHASQLIASNVSSPFPSGSACETERHACDPRPYVSYRRPRGCSSRERSLGRMIGWQSDGKSRFCSSIVLAGDLAKYLK